MDENTILGSIATGLVALLLFPVRRLFVKVDEVEKAQAAAELDGAKNYVTKREFNTTIDRFERKMSENFGRMFDRLDGKKDKS